MWVQAEKSRISWYFYRAWKKFYNLGAWSDAAYCGILSESALFAYVLFMERRDIYEFEFTIVSHVGFRNIYILSYYAHAWSYIIFKAFCFPFIGSFW